MTMVNLWQGGTWKRWVPWTAAAAGSVATAGYAVMTVRYELLDSDFFDWLNGLSLVAFAIGFGSIGFLLTLKRPDHPVGWVMLAFGVIFAVRLAFEASLPGLEGGGQSRAVFVANALAPPVVGLLVVLAVLFPGGVPKGKWWRLALVVVAGGMVVGVLDAPFHGYETVQTTYPAPLVEFEPAVAFEGVTQLAYFFILGAALIRLVVMQRRGDAVARQQIRWVAYAVVLTFAVLPLYFLVPDANVVAGVIAGFGIPLGIAIAITRYRLYDIDRIVNRTVVYAVVIGLLGLLFVAGALLLPSMLPITDNNVAVAVSTLVVFFLFNPLRVRVQRFVDRRFYRSRYDAQQVADELAGRLRDQVDPDAVAGEWVEVVQRTLAPATVAVWVREDA